MSAKQSAETKYAIHLHLMQGKGVTEACRLAGIFPSTLYRALKQKPKKQKAQSS